MFHLCYIVCFVVEIDATANQKPYEKVEEKIIRDYISVKMMNDQKDGSLILPEIDDFDIIYVRKSVRQTYSQDSDGVPCTLTVSKEQETIKRDADADSDKRVRNIDKELF